MKLISDYEVKLLLGISGTDKDALISAYNEFASEILRQALMVGQVERHTVTRERVKVLGDGDTLYLRDFPVDTSETITIEDYRLQEVTDIFFKLDPYELFTLRIVDSEGVETGILQGEVFASYTAGWRVYSQIEVIDLTSLADKTITVTTDGTAVTWTLVSATPSTHEILIGADLATTAANIAAAIGGSSSGAVVTMSDVGITIDLGTATSTQLEITDPDLPADIKNVIAYIVGGAIADKDKLGGVTSYSIGSKSVSFADTSQVAIVDLTLKKYGAGRKRSFIRGI